MLAQLPGHIPAVAYAPRLRLVIEDLEESVDALSLLDPQLKEQPLPVLLSELIFGTNSPLESLAEPDRSGAISRLATAEGLQRIGVDPQGAFYLVPYPADGVALLSFGLTERPRFEAWLGRIAPERRHTSVVGEQASVLASESDRPVTCLSRSARAYCQIGASSGDDAIAHLRKLHQFSGSTLGERQGLKAAYGKLAPGARLQLLVQPAPLADQLSATFEKKIRRAQRFSAPKTRKQTLNRLRRKQARLRSAVKLVEGAAAGFYRHSDHIALRWEAKMSSAGQRALIAAVPPTTPDLPIAQWARTPALFSAIARVAPMHLQKLLGALGLPVPQDALSGTVAMLALGLDTECAFAKQETKAAPAMRPPHGWAFLFPSALNVGLTNKTAADQTFKNLSTIFEVGEKTGFTPRAPLRGRVLDSGYEVHVLDDMLVIGTGPGSGAAAIRKLRGLSPQSSEQTPPFFRAAVHLRAINEAFAAGNFRGEHRKELLSLETARLKLKPFLQRFSKLEVSAKALERHQRVQMQVKLFR